MAAMSCEFESHPAHRKRDIFVEGVSFLYVSIVSDDFVVISLEMFGNLGSSELQHLKAEDIKTDKQDP